MPGKQHEERGHSWLWTTGSDILGYEMGWENPKLTGTTGMTKVSFHVASLQASLDWFVCNSKSSKSNKRKSIQGFRGLGLELITSAVLCGLKQGIMPAQIYRVRN